MQVSSIAITRQGETAADVLRDAIIRLYEREPDLLDLPAAVFDGAAAITGAAVIAYTEMHPASSDFRALVSVDDDPVRRAPSMQAYARHMHSHPFWQCDPQFFGERALRESDFFSETEYAVLPIAQEALLPSRSQHIMSIVIAHEGYLLTIGCHRVTGQPAFSDAERDRLQAYRAHILRVYRQAQERTLARLSVTDRLRMAFPALTPRQLEVASWVSQGKSNDDISMILDVSIDTVKAHVKAIYEKMGVDGRHTAAVAAHTVAPFANMPPLWKLALPSWSGLSSASATG